MLAVAVLPEQPPIPADADLRQYPRTPLDRRRLFASTFHTTATDTEWRAGVTLWFKSFDEVPAGSLPADDRSLCHLAELGRDLAAWRRIKRVALHGWKLAADGRLYHAVVTEFVLEILALKDAWRERTAAARAARRKPVTENATDVVTDNVTSSVTSRISISRKGSLNTEITNPKPARTRGNGVLDNKIIGLDAGARSARLRRFRADSSQSLSRRTSEHSREALRMKLLRYVDARLSGGARSEAISGLCGTDPNPAHTDQWWLDKLDRRMRAEHWNDTEGSE